MSLVHQIAARAVRGLEAETAHLLTVRALAAGLGPRDRAAADPVLATELAGLKLPNGLGLAAGFDKNAEVPDAMLAAGFGFVECGTVTPLAQAGNPMPRLFRLEADQAVINRMGFNNAGLDPFAARLARRRGRGGIVGANIGANKHAPDRIADYVTGLQRVWGLCDYVVVNVSSPNTPGLRDLQSRAALEELAGRLAEARTPLKAAGDTPILLKVAPDLADQEAPGIAAMVRRFGLDGVIVSNTTIARPAGLASPARGETGGLSGAPLMGPATRMLRLFHEADPTLPLVGAGGVASGADAYAKVRAGASAVQLYTALVYGGPELVVRIKRDLALRLRADGFASLGDARGAA